MAFSRPPQVFDQNVGIYERPLGHGLPLCCFFASLVKLLTQRLEVWQVRTVLPHTPRATKKLSPVSLLVAGYETVHGLADQIALGPSTPARYGRQCPTLFFC